MAEQVFMTVAETAELLRCSSAAVYKKIKRGTLRGARKLGKTVLLRRSDVLASCVETSVPSPTAEA
jgi:excisionase family DNA binding protein